MPVRALRPYAHNPTIRRAKLDIRRADDPIRKLYKTATWRATRLLILFRDPVCKLCHKAASTIADHIVAARKFVAQHNDDLSSFFDDNNLQGSCKKCHDAKTARECQFAGSGEGRGV